MLRPIVPTIVSQVNDFIDAVPGYVADLTEGKGRLGFLEREYQITERVRDALSEGGATKVLGLSGTALAVTKGVITAVFATLTIAFLTLFMLLEGPAWIERLYCALARGEATALARDRRRTSTGRSAVT